jgi:polysaccharide pyruvyl transferase WcaK-like protein
MNRVAAYQELVSSAIGRSVIQYIGAVHISNLGDEALVQLARELFAPLPVQALTTQSRVQRFLTTIRPKQRRLLLLGGGTLLNHPWIMSTVKTQLKSCSAAFTFGTGVNDPHSGISGNLQEEAETLKQFQLVAVRGPHSKEMLEAKGLTDVEIIGDSAFCLIPDQVPTTAPDKVAVLNYGVINEKCLVGDAETIERTFVSVGKMLVQRGYLLKLLVVRPCDLQPSIELAAKIGPENKISILPEYHDIGSAQDFMRGASLFVGLKMHAGVIAMSAGVPALLVEYQLKVRDLLEGVGLERYLVSSDAFQAKTILEHLESLEHDRSEVLDGYQQAGIATRNRYSKFVEVVGAALK